MSMEKKKIKDWGEKEMRDFLEKEGLKRLKKLFEETQNTDDDQENSDSSEENSKYDPTAIKNAENYFLDKKSKVLNDPIHGLMELHPLLIKIMDTPQFQRLRYIKQLGGAYFVYPGASHNRFEHSVGVAHLAGELARALRSKQPELKIDERDILCVQIAGLCHDLGHGPFSHLYDGIFIPKACRETKWKHEDASLRMFDHLVEDNGLKPLMELYGLKPEENDLEFIREMIQGKPLTEDQWRYKGRTEEKSFLYEIVANKLNGIDVDKFDYLARDAYHLGMQSNFDHKRFIMLARVYKVDGRNHICSRDKEVGNLYDMFHTRYCLHRRVCQHKTHKAIEIMISDAFLKADKHIEIEGSGPESCKLSTAKDDMVAYTKLTDQVFERILHPWSSSPDLEEARNILQRIVSRNLYMFVDETKIPQQKIDAWKAELAQDHANDENQAANAQVTSDQKETPKTSEQKMDKLKPELAQDHAKDENQADNVEITIVTFDYGKKEEDPINNTYFYSKDEKRGGFKISSKQKSKLLPASFSETIMRVYCKNAENVNLEGARKAFEDWCSKNGFAVPEDQDKAEEGK